MWESICTILCAVTIWSETQPNMSFGSNGVGWIHLLLKTRKWFRYRNRCISKCRTRFAQLYAQQQNGQKHTQTWVLCQMESIGCVRCVKLKSNFGYRHRCINSTCGTRFAQLYAQSRNGPKHTQTWVLGLMEWIRSLRCVKLKSCFGYTNRCINSTCGTRSAQFYA